MQMGFRELRLSFIKYTILAGCPDNVLSNLESRTIMEANGWVFEFSFNSNFASITHSMSGYNIVCGAETWYGWAAGSPVGAVSVTLKGIGIAALNFGSCNSIGYVEVYLNNLAISKAEANVKNQHVTFAYSTGDILTIAEFDNSIIKLNTISFACQGN